MRDLARMDRRATPNGQHIKDRVSKLRRHIFDDAGEYLVAEWFENGERLWVGFEESRQRSHIR